MDTIEWTVEIETEGGWIDYLIIPLPKNEKLTDEIVQEWFELYSNDEAGENLKGDKLENYTVIRKD